MCLSSQKFIALHECAGAAAANIRRRGRTAASYQLDRREHVIRNVTTGKLS